MPTIVLIFLVTLCTIASQLLLKRAVGDIAFLLKSSGTSAFFWAAVTSPGVLLALAIQGAGYLGWMFVLTRAQLGQSFVTAGAFGYVLMALATWLFFGERLSAIQWVGVLLVSGGVLLVGLGNGVAK